MGTKSSKESLPLLQEQCYEFIMYRNAELSDNICNMFNVIDKYEQDEDESSKITIVLFRYKNSLCKMIFTDSMEYVKKRSINTIVSYNDYDRMSWYKALDMINHIKGEKIMLCYNITDRRRSVVMSDICQLADDVNQYQIESTRDIYNIITLILEKHILNIPEL